MRVMIVVTHLLGTGHLARALTLGRAFGAAGHDVCVVSGGSAVPHLDSGPARLIQLPPLHSDGTNFTTLLDSADQPANAALLQARQDQLVDCLHRHQPDVLISELYPFGRRVLADEFLHLLGAAQEMTPAPVILSSIRDILAPPSKPTKAIRADEIIAQYYDGVLVHSDPAATKLDQSWPVSDQLSPYLHYTGYVAPPAAGPHSHGAGKDEILVSAGGGSVGDALFRAALGAAKLTADQQWRILIGGKDAQARIQGFAPLAGPNCILEPARPDFRQMLSHVACSISMCGYNTALDLLQAGTPAVLVPFDDGSEVEQSLRADALAQMDGFSVLSSRDLTPENLADAARHIQNAPRRTPGVVQTDGATQSVNIAQTLHEARI